MANGYSYLVLGSGKQGLAAAYDLLKYGNTAQLTLADGDLGAARAAVLRLRKLLGSKLRKGVSLSAQPTRRPHERSPDRLGAGTE